MFPTSGFTGRGPDIRRHRLYAIGTCLGEPCSPSLAGLAAKGQRRTDTSGRLEIQIMVSGVPAHVITIEEVLDQEPQDLKVDRIDREDTNLYTGVLLREFFEASGVDLQAFGEVVARAADQYQVALLAKEVLEDDDVYLVYKINGVPLSPREEGGSGPYRVVIRSDEFGQRWTSISSKLIC